MVSRVQIVHRSCSCVRWVVIVHVRATPKTPTHSRYRCRCKTLATGPWNKNLKQCIPCLRLPNMHARSICLLIHRDTRQKLEQLENATRARGWPWNMQAAITAAITVVWHWNLTVCHDQVDNERRWRQSARARWEQVGFWRKKVWGDSRNRTQMHSECSPVSINTIIHEACQQLAQPILCRSATWNKDFALTPKRCVRIPSLCDSTGRKIAEARRKQTRDAASSSGERLAKRSWEGLWIFKHFHVVDHTVVTVKP